MDNSTNSNTTEALVRRAEEMAARARRRHVRERDFSESSVQQVCAPPGAQDPESDQRVA